MSIRIYYDRGIRFRFKNKDKQNTFVIDPISTQGISSRNKTFITHSHLDHSVALPNSAIPIFTTKIASEIYQILSSKTVKNINFVKYFEAFYPDSDVEVEFLPAGHLLGAAQILFKFPKGTILYTGDISTDNMLTVPSAHVPDTHVDTLIIESTYGTPNLFFPPRNEIRHSLFMWISKTLAKRRIPVINIGYSGPAQEIIAFLNKMLSLDILVDSKTAKLNRLYTKEGIDLKWKNFEEKNIDMSLENSIVLLPRGKKTIPEFLHSYKISRAIVTGQATRFAYRTFDMAFPFSMHANFNELMEHIEKIKPKRVYTIYGFEEEFARAVRKKFGIRAIPLKNVGKNLTIDHYF